MNPSYIISNHVHVKGLKNNLQLSKGPLHPLQPVSVFMCNPSVFWILNGVLYEKLGNNRNQRETFWVLLISMSSWDSEFKHDVFPAGLCQFRVLKRKSCHLQIFDKLLVAFYT